MIANHNNNLHRAFHLINGSPSDQVSIYDRGLQYGDGVFRTMRVHAGHILHWQRHYQKLQQDSAALGITCPQSALLSDELQRLIQQQPEGVAKIILTRGLQTARGYALPSYIIPTRIVSIMLAPNYPDHFYSRGIKLRVCELRLGHQPRLAGIKHLNRLENVLAAAEWSDADIAEGVLLDTAGNVIAGTRSNLFMVRDGVLLTPDLSRCGVAGVQRDRVMEWAIKHGVPCHIERFGLPELLAADEMFLVNSVIGLWPVRELQGRPFRLYPMSMQIQKWLNHAPD